MAELLRHMTLFNDLFSFAELQQILSDESRVQRMLDFEAALAKAAARAGAIPQGAAHKIAEHCRSTDFDLSTIAKQAARSGNPAIPLVKLLTVAVARQLTHVT